MNIFILIVLIVAALWTMMTRSLLRSAIGLALTSALLTVLMFRFQAPLAAVFELSVCTGLISVLFISTISLTHPLSKQEVLQQMKERISRFWYLPLLVVLAGIALSLFPAKLALNMPKPELVHDVRMVLWNLRQLDIFGQIIVILAGVLGVVILLKERPKDA